jgi:hypothetical protein
MRTRVAAVQLCVHTPDGALGNTVEFSSGLNIIRGGTSRGKTQLIQAVVYGLGLESMRAARANAPLGNAFTRGARLERDGIEVARPVMSSWVAVELVNANGAALTAQRHVRHPRYKRDLVRVWDKPVITSSRGDGAASEYFLRAPGSAAQDLSFHAMLADFLGWDLPMVRTLRRDEIPLPLDVVAPFLIADRQSWVVPLPRKVERYQLHEPLRRAAEFLLALDPPQARDAFASGQLAIQLARQLQDRLSASHFASYPPSEIQIDNDTLRPTGNGFDLDIAANPGDAFRMKVAYLDSIRAIGSTFGPHPGSLILDEPDRPGLEPHDYASMLQYLAASSVEDRQTILRSTTPRPELDALLGASGAHIVELGEARLLQPTAAPGPMDTGGDS